MRRGVQTCTAFTTVTMVMAVWWPWYALHLEMTRYVVWMLPKRKCWTFVIFLWHAGLSRSRDGLETYQRLVSVSSRQKLSTCSRLCLGRLTSRSRPFTSRTQDQFSAKLWMPRNKISYRRDDVHRRSLSRSRSFNVTNFDTNRKPVCDFQVNNTKVHTILYRFPVIAQYLSNYHLWQRNAPH